MDAKFRDFTTSKLKVNTIDIYPTDVTPGTGDLFANMYMRGSTAEDAFMRIGFETLTTQSTMIAYILKHRKQQLEYFRMLLKFCMIRQLTQIN